MAEFEEPLTQAVIAHETVHFIIVTGFGRKTVSFAYATKTEIALSWLINTFFRQSAIQSQ